MATPLGLRNGILIPRPETEPGPQRWKHQVPTTGPPGNSQGYFFFFSKDIILNNHNTVITLRESNIVNNTTIRL